MTAILVTTVLTMALALAGLAACCVRERAARVELQTSHAALERDFRATCAAQSRLGDRLIALERQSRGLVQSQTQLQMKTPATEQYRHAIALVERGAGTDDLVTTCGLARGEAELVHRVHRAAR